MPFGQKWGRGGGVYNFSLDLSARLIILLFSVAFIFTKTYTQWYCRMEGARLLRPSGNSLPGLPRLSQASPEVPRRFPRKFSLCMLRATQRPPFTFLRSRANRSLFSSSFTGFFCRKKACFVHSHIHLAITPKGPFRTKNGTAPESVVFCYRRSFLLSVPFSRLLFLEKQAFPSTLRTVLLPP